MKVYGNKKNKLGRIKKKDFELQDKIYKKGEEKIKESFFGFCTVVFIIIILLFKYDFFKNFFD
jgi:hypothetical protein